MTKCIPANKGSLCRSSSGQSYEWSWFQRSQILFVFRIYPTINSQNNTTNSVIPIIFSSPTAHRAEGLIFWIPCQFFSNPSSGQYGSFCERNVTNDLMCTNYQVDSPSWTLMQSSNNAWHCLTFIQSLSCNVTNLNLTFSLLHRFIMC